MVPVGNEQREQERPKRRPEGASMISQRSRRGRHLSATAALLSAVLIMTGAARAQQIVVVVNGEPITALDIEQRSKLNQLSTHKVPPRQEVLDELITEVLKVKEAKKWGLEVSDAEVDTAFAGMANRMRLTPDQLTQVLAKAGVNVATLRHRIRADVTWPQLVRGRFQSSLQIGEKEVLTAGLNTKPEEAVGYDYMLRPIIFLIPTGSTEAFIEARRRDAEALRNRFKGCDEGVAFARALKDVAVREPVMRSSADFPPELRKALDSIEVGKLSPPEITKLGIEMFAICSKKQSAADNMPGARRVRESIVAERYEQRSKEYLKEIRRGAMIEYK
jgi:peptidyl-prolyl cis-trans isomerase SurA